METKQAVQALSALAQDTRLGIFRLLVQAGPEGMPAGQIGEKLDLPPATLSFHLAGLTRAGLAHSRQEGRFVIYSADYAAMNALVGFLSENCCGGRECTPMTGDHNETTTRTRRRA
jgi:ArsR family transcriptional regulator